VERARAICGAAHWIRDRGVRRDLPPDAQMMTRTMCPPRCHREVVRRAPTSDRLPPGQIETTKWPVLHYGMVPHIDTAMDVQGLGCGGEAVRLVMG